jgi:hypothetical protein
MFTRCKLLGKQRLAGAIRQPPMHVNIRSEFFEEVNSVGARIVAAIRRSES